MKTAINPERLTAVPTDYKDSNNSVIIAKIKGLFLTGRKYTAKQLNSMLGFNDARKAISVLRSNGMQIADLRLPNNCKLYWYVPDNNQLNLWKGQEL